MQINNDMLESLKPLFKRDEVIKQIEEWKASAIGNNTLSGPISRADNLGLTRGFTMVLTLLKATHGESNVDVEVICNRVNNPDTCDMVPPSRFQVAPIGYVNKVSTVNPEPEPRMETLFSDYYVGKG